ncbi:hypothetical protein QE152_g8603 [Popillia japonica]|uniref:Uncharacterized protein n=1 Tax=Popillia japonica TaxID=7064 RepID=A0AAW1M3X7_POPJA
MVVLKTQGFLNNEDLILQLMDTRQPLILGCVETPVYEEVTDNEIIIEAYNLVKAVATNRSTGGVLLVFDSEWNNRGDVNEMKKDWKGTIQNIMDGMCPRKEILIAEIHKANKWITASVLHEMKIRDEKYKVAIATASTESWEEYRKHRNKVVQLVRSNKEEYLRNIIDGNKSNLSEL